LTWQLREYTVKPGEMAAWIDEWRTRIVPLRERFGFRVLGAWTVDGTDQFVWIITYQGAKSWQDADADYYGSPERKAIAPDPARHLAHTQARLMTGALKPKA
jgi:hypothetical protein